jgi:hypothetical protein
MTKKFLQLVERNRAQELQAYFAHMPKGRPLDKHEELVLLEAFPEVAISSYINRFRFSEDAEQMFIEKAPGNLRRAYINYYGLQPTTQKFILDKDLTDAAFDFIRMRHFADVEYLLKNGNPQVIRSYVQNNVLENDDQVLMLLYHENKSLFKAYVDAGYFISERVQREVIESGQLSAFNALMFRVNRTFKKKARTMTFEQMKAKQVPDVMLADDLQVLVLDGGDRMFTELLLRTTPLAPVAQRLMFERNFDAEWFKFHVEHLYGVAGYRFEPEMEPLLFKVLAKKNLDECLATFCQRDDVVFVQNASTASVTKYIKDHWLSDDAQVALFARGDAELAKKLISRYTPEHGLCWQAEVKMVEIYSPETINLYTSFHSMCGEALARLGQKSKDAIDFYYSRHAY